MGLWSGRCGWWRPRRRKVKTGRVIRVKFPILQRLSGTRCRWVTHLVNVAVMIRCHRRLILLLLLLLKIRLNWVTVLVKKRLLTVSRLPFIKLFQLTLTLRCRYWVNSSVRNISIRVKPSVGTRFRPCFRFLTRLIRFLSRLALQLMICLLTLIIAGLQRRTLRFGTLALPLILIVPSRLMTSGVILRWTDRLKWRWRRRKITFRFIMAPWRVMVVMSPRRRHLFLM